MLAILTEWNEFRGLDLARLKSIMAAPIMVDLRNIYNPEDMVEAGFDYSCIGRADQLPQAKSKAAE